VKSPRQIDDSPCFPRFYRGLCPFAGPLPSLPCKRGKSQGGGNAGQEREVVRDLRSSTIHRASWRFFSLSKAAWSTRSVRSCWRTLR
jgi:hypothetical protein